MFTTDACMFVACILINWIELSNFYLGCFREKANENDTVTQFGAVLSMYYVMIMCCVWNSHFYTDWFEYRWKHYRRIKHSMKTYERKPPPPHGYNITKGSAHIAVTREFVQHVLTDRKARDLLDWMSDIRVPDEHFFQTLNHNPHNPAPGSFPGTFIVFCRLMFATKRSIVWNYDSTASN